VQRDGSGSLAVARWRRQLVGGSLAAADWSRQLGGGSTVAALSATAAAAWRWRFDGSLAVACNR